MWIPSWAQYFSVVGGPWRAGGGGRRLTNGTWSCFLVKTGTNSGKRREHLIALAPRWWGGILVGKKNFEPIPTAPFIEGSHGVEALQAGAWLGGHKKKNFRFNLTAGRTCRARRRGCGS